MHEEGGSTLMKLRLRICSKCGNLTSMEWDDETTRLFCPICRLHIYHRFTDFCFNEITEKEAQKSIDAEVKEALTLDAYRLRDWKKILGHYPDRSVPSQAKFHHKVWKAKGGSDNPKNIIAICGRCHAKAHNNYNGYRKGA